MKLFVGVTNNDWFRFLSERNPDKVNFWRPRSQTDFRALQPGDLFLFKLHSPLDFIPGGGVFVRHTFLPPPLAWQAFGEKNGVPDFETFERRILEHRDQAELIRQLGCTILVQPFFWSRDLWIPVPGDWKKNIVTGKGYSIASPAGMALWTEIRSRLDANAVPEVAAVTEEQARYGAPMTIRPRLGQGAFRVEVTDAYSRRCAITGEKTLPALEAAHIRPYAKNGPHEIRNGLLLRSDLHNLFELGYLTVTLDYPVAVSRRIREEFENGRHYYAARPVARPPTTTPGIATRAGTPGVASRNLQRVATFLSFGRHQRSRSPVMPFPISAVESPAGALFFRRVLPPTSTSRIWII